MEDLKRTEAYASLEIYVDCPYCSHYQDSRDNLVEHLTDGELSVNNIEAFITCEECKEDFIVTKIEY